MSDGKICYVEIPATDIDISSNFHSKVFGWKARARGDSARAFDDATGAVSGIWIHDRTPARDPGMVTYILVDSIEATLKKVTAKGGKIATPTAPLRPNGEACTTILDPAGNLVGIYQVGRH